MLFKCRKFSKHIARILMPLSDHMPLNNKSAEKNWSKQMANANAKYDGFKLFVRCAIVHVAPVYIITAAYFQAV